MVKIGTSRRLKKSAASKKLRRRDFFTYFMEVLLIIFGISVAYQLNVYYEGQKDLQLEKAALRKVYRENETNMENFYSIVPSRNELQEDTRELARILFSGGLLEDDNIGTYLFNINRTYKPIIQLEAINFYLNTNYTNRNSDVKSELITLKSKYLELRDVVDYYVRMKEKYYSEFLVSDVDFGEEKIISYEKIKSVEFKNLVVNLLANEQELNRLFEDTFELALDLDEMIEEKLH
ncbi:MULTISPECIES: hypothetical protein [Roseivirga]|uniref:Uncharacterized protein n=1 Tax=Roseivirga spongicola TaxID=333140 RepID=A0A150X902_9BACT|nr:MULTISPECIES: hypothetical protein [Roseivirga]KYG75217.1 hypothetical protein AWW68_10445 [Roseivirga spongicola]MBO6661992.1 hypothetical protein [Roseivirga sp.]MBO6909419.1 hypothetical protein [Roseivirga sp.]PWL27521.1 MAG: hypothetical protein DCO95_17120 [Roseivirga sp. XM-24bin3]